MLDKIIEIATKYHRDQFRKEEINNNRLPYISHPMEVMKMVYVWGAGTEDNLSAAISHDLLEDTAIPKSEVKNEVGDRVFKIIEELTFIPPKDAINKKELKEKYLKSFKYKSIEALIIKLADRICNIADFQRSDTDYAKKYYEKAICLFDLFYQRDKEIIVIYGVKTYEAMNFDIDNLQWEMGN